MNGSMVIMKIPNPNPVVRCTNAAPMVNNISVVIFLDYAFGIDFQLILPRKSSTDMVNDFLANRLDIGAVYVTHHFRMQS